MDEDLGISGEESRTDVKWARAERASLAVTSPGPQLHLGRGPAAGWTAVWTEAGRQALRARPGGQHHRPQHWSGRAARARLGLMRHFD